MKLNEYKLGFIGGFVFAIVLVGVLALFV